MAIIMVPTMPAFERDLLTNLRLLEEIVQPKGHEIGLEVIGKPEHFLEAEGRQRMIDNLKKHAGGMRLASHQWSGNIIYDSSPENLAFSDLRTKRGKRVINSGVAFAQEVIDAGLVPDEQEVYVHTHGGDLYFGARLSEAKLQRDREQIKQSLLEVAGKNPRIRIGLENLPLLPNSDDPDLIDSPEKVGRTVIEKLEDYRGLVEGTDLRLTFDVAHYAYDTPLGANVDLIAAVDIFGDYLRHIHVSDAKGIWEPHKSVAGDGYVPGIGKIGNQGFREFFRHLNEHYDLSQVSIEAEVKDKDYNNLENRAETLRRIVGWLD